MSADSSEKAAGMRVCFLMSSDSPERLVKFSLQSVPDVMYLCT